MATIEERVSFLEGRVMEQSNIFAGIYKTLESLDRRMTSLEQRMDSRLTALDQKIDLRVAALEHKLDQRFAWLIGLQITTILAFVGAVVAILKR